MYDNTVAIDGQFREYLRSTKTVDQVDCVHPEFNDTKTWNGTGDDLYSIYGVHLLIHDNGCSTGMASAESSIIDDSDFDDSETCAEAEHAFDTGLIAWSPGSCNDTGQAKNSAIQEPLHQFILALQKDVKPMLGDDDGDSEDGLDFFDEHSLGIVNGSGEVSPMLTYHDSEFFNAGSCKSDQDLASAYTQSLTNCTKNAVEFIARDSDCNSQPSSIC